jgi:phosphonate transport system substrate-binding protein
VTAANGLAFTSCMSDNEDFILEAVVGYLAGKLSVPVDLVDQLDWEARQARFDRDLVQVCWICGLPYVWKADQTPSDIELLAAPVMRGERYRGMPVYFSEVVVRADSPYRHFEDLRGSIWAFNEPGSHSGYNSARFRLAGLEAPETFFGETQMSGSHLASLAGILEGRFEGSAIDSVVLELYLQDHPEHASQLRSLEILGPSPIPPLIVRKSVVQELRNEVREALLTMHAEPEGQRVLASTPVAGFVAVADRQYDPIREVDHIASGINL